MADTGLNHGSADELPIGVTMTTLVIEHFKVSELPAQWAQHLNAQPGQTVTVRIETEAPASADTTSFVTADPAFGIWRDRDEVADVAAFAGRLRAPRYAPDGSRTDE
jgi:hypothetical protein